jgi:hypothetical protein
MSLTGRSRRIRVGRPLFSAALFSALISTALFGTAASPLAQTGPAPGATHLDGEVIALACSPTLSFTAPAPSLLVTGGQDASTRYLYRPGDLITINGGSDNGIEVGQEYFVRRAQAPRGSGVSRTTPAIIRTAGWIRVYAVDSTMSLATIAHACDAIEIGDYLEPFVLPQRPTADVNPAKPQRENYGHILIGSDRRTMFAKSDFFTVDRGSDHGVTIGARFIIYRDKRRTETAKLPVTSELPPAVVNPEFLFEIGEAVAVNVEPEVSTLQATTARSAFVSGDFVAIRK